MDVSELAALVAREADLGVAAALSGVDAAGVLSIDRVIARVGAVPPDGATSLDDVAWQAEIVLRASDRPEVSIAPDVLPKRLADLPVAALRGVGDTWGSRFVQAGLPRVGDLAVADRSTLHPLATGYGTAVLGLAGRARTLVAPWPTLPPGAAGWGSLLDIARGDPADLPTDRILALSVWNRCLGALSALDSGVLAGITLG